MEEGYNFAQGVFAKTISKDELCVNGGDRLLLLSGPLSEILSFLQPLQGHTPATFEDCARRLKDDSEATKASFSSLFDTLVQFNAIVPVGANLRALSYRRILCITGIENPLVLSELLEAGVDRISIARVTPGSQHSATSRAVTISVEETSQENGKGRIELMADSFQDILATLLQSVTDYDLVSVCGLDEFHLHTINQIMLEQNLPWLFMVESAGKWIISPVLRTGETPCYHCLRMRRLGSIQDVLPNAVLAQRLTESAPEIPCHMGLTPSERLALTSQFIRKLSLDAAGTGSLFSVVSAEGALASTMEIMRMPDCFACSHVKPAN